MEPMTYVNIGVDIGQRVDYTAVSVAEAGARPTGCTVKAWVPDPFGVADAWADEPEQETLWLIRHLERLPLGTSYPDVAKRIAQIIANLGKRHAEQSKNELDPPTLRLRLLVDQTGVGAPVLDLIRAALRDSACTITGVTFACGDRYERGGREARLGKAFLVSHLQALLQTGRIQLPRASREAQSMREELLNYQIKVDPDGMAKFGAFSTGAHDDLATALGLACLEDPRRYTARTAPSIYV